MNNAAFLVDGHLEKKFVQNICPNKPVRILNCNGNAVSTKAIAKRVATQCRLLRGKRYPIVIITDLEDRNMTPQQFHDSLLTEIENEGVNDQIIIGIPNQMIENWIIADKKILIQHTSKKPLWYKTKSPDGYNGKNHLKFLLGSYHETTTGVELLKSCSPVEMCKSPSFKSFFNKIRKKKCWWLQQ